MSKTTLKKALNELSKPEIIEVISEMYTACPQARNYLEYWIDPDPVKKTEETKTLIRRVFFTSTDKSRAKPTVSDISRIIKEFSLVCPGSGSEADLRYFGLESFLDWMKDKKKASKSQRTMFVNMAESLRAFAGEKGSENVAEKVVALTEHAEDVWRALDRLPARSRKYFIFK